MESCSSRARNVRSCDTAASFSSALRRRFSMAPARCAVSASSSERSAADRLNWLWKKRSTSPISRSCCRIGIDTTVSNPASLQWCMPRGLHRLDRNDAHARRRRRRAAEAVAGLDALLAVGHRRGQTLGGEQQVALVGLVGPAQRDAVGVRDAADVPRESGGQFLQRRGLGGQRRHVVERFQALALFLQLGGLFGDLALRGSGTSTADVPPCR